MLGLSQTASGTLIAAMIAAAASVLGLIISKETKISEFRQQWIDSLRLEISKIISRATAIHRGDVAIFPDAMSKWSAVKDDYIAINEAVASVRLRLNTKELQSRDVLSRIIELEGLLQPHRGIDAAELDDCLKGLASAAQVLLKSEWSRVRRGEAVFFVAKWISIVLAASVIAIFIFRLFLHEVPLSGCQILQSSTFRHSPPAPHQSYPAP